MSEYNEDNVKDTSETETNPQKQPLFDRLTLFLLCFILCVFVGLVAGWFLKNWYLGLILGSFFGAAVGLILVYLCRKNA